jgi:putative spermidine/putrescine transport system permease protein
MTRVAVRRKRALPSARVQARDPLQRIGRLMAWSTAIVCLAPLPLLLSVATTRQWRSGFWAEGFTLQWMAAGWERIAPHAWFSLRLALLVLLLDILIGLPAAWSLARRQFPGRQLILSLSVLPLAIPGIAVALGLILSYPYLRGNGYLLFIGHVLYTLPFFVGALTPVLGTHSLLEREEVAKTLGAGAVQRFFVVVLPTIRRGLLAAAIMVITLSMGEFNVSFFLYTPTAKTLPVELYSSYITGRLEEAAGMTVWFLLFVVPAAIVLERFGGGKVGQA